MTCILMKNYIDIIVISTIFSKSSADSESTSEHARSKKKTKKGYRGGRNNKLRKFNFIAVITLNFPTLSFPEYRQKSREMTMQRLNNDEENLHPMHLLKFHVTSRIRLLLTVECSHHQIHQNPGALGISRVSTTFWIHQIENNFFACFFVSSLIDFFIKSVFDSAGGDSENCLMFQKVELNIHCRKTNK